MKHFFFLVCCIQYFVCNSQTFNGIIKYNSTPFAPVEFASIVNKNNQNHALSDSKGKFSINALVKDTLEISHLNAVSIKYVVGSKKRDTISVPQNINSLKEVVVPSQKNKKSRVKRKLHYGSLPETSFGIKINVDDIKTRKPIKKIIFAMKFIKDNSNQGTLKIQFVKSLDAIPFLQPIIISVNEIRKDDEIVIDLANQTANELKSDFFIIIDRIIENRIFKKNDRNLSANPHFRCIETTDIKECNFFIKDYRKKRMCNCKFYPHRTYYFFYNFLF